MFSILLVWMCWTLIFANHVQGFNQFIPLSSPPAKNWTRSVYPFAVPNEPYYWSRRRIRSNDYSLSKTAEHHQPVMPPLILNPSDANDQTGLLYEDDSSNQCIIIHEPICQGLQYTHTRFPNPVGLTSQDEAAKRMNDYRALISVGCSHYLKFFLCTVYFPMCTPQLNTLTTLQPCETLCRYVQSKCEPIMKSFSFPWPKELNCNGLPKSTEMCIQPQNYDLDQQQQPSASLLSRGLSGVGPQAIAELLPDLTQLFSNNQRRPEDTHSGDPEGPVSSETFENAPVPQTIITEETVPITTRTGHACRISHITLLTEKTSVPNKNITCAQQCGAHVFYRPAEKQFANIWILVWSVLCAMSCFLTLVTFVLDRARFAYPERPIIYISACYLFYSLGFLVKLGLGRERVACREFVTNTPSPMATAITADMINTHLSPVSGALHSHSTVPLRESYLILSGYEGTWCTVVFILLYYFSQASYIWWLMLSVTWFLSAACKWGAEGIETISSVLHMFAWAIPALKTMIVLIMHRIDADELTGLCHIGYQDPNSLLFFVLIPQICYLLIGMCFLALGFFSLVTVRSNLKHHAATLLQPNRAHTPQVLAPSACSSLFGSNMAVIHNGNVRRLDKLMAKICIFSILYIIPTICVIGVNAYTFGNFYVWQQALDRLEQRPDCLTVHGTNWAQADRCLEDLRFPSVEVNMLQIFMSLAVGITSGMWVWCNRKTMDSWTQCTRRNRGRRSTQLKKLSIRGVTGATGETRSRSDTTDVHRIKPDTTNYTVGSTVPNTALTNANKQRSQMGLLSGGLSSGTSANEQAISLAQRPNNYTLNFGHTPVSYCPSATWGAPPTLNMALAHLNEPHSEMYTGNAS